MAIQRYRTLILLFFSAAALLISSPALQQLLVYPNSDCLTEFWLLGPDHDSAYPTNVTAEEVTHLYLDISNHLGSCAYYVVEVKFRNLTQSGPDSFNHTGSSLPSYGSITVIVADNATVEVPLDISFQYHVDSRISTRIHMQSITVNDFELPINSTSIDWDISRGGFYGNLFFELWLYNSTTQSLQYHQRYNSLWLKMVPALSE
ncbi:MAG: hypothetical protein ACQCN4_05840 [Candidatus Bathyarchaeia archaeon]